MKKIITLLLAVGAFAAADAQTTKEEARRVILGGGKNGSGDNNTTRGRDVILGDGNGSNTRNYPGSREAQIDQINREYDAKIISIRNNPNLSAEEKERIIRNLERERQRKIRQVKERYDGDNDDDDKYAKKNKKDKKYKSNNGKRLGWEKGVGNPHKNGGTPGKGKSKGKGRG